MKKHRHALHHVDGVKGKKEGDSVPLPLPPSLSQRSNILQRSTNNSRMDKCNY